MTRFRETPHLVNRDTLLDVAQNLFIAAFVADEEQVQTAFLEFPDVPSSRFARLLRLQVRPCGASFFAIALARGRLTVKVSSSKKNSLTCGKILFR